MRISLFACALLITSLLPAAASAQEAELTANVGWVSEYLYRGIAQKSSSASAGIDLAVGPLYLGSWAADVGDGSEVDLYGGLGYEVRGVSLSAGGTGYFYTGEFDDTYLEGNLGMAFGPLSADFAVGSYRTEPEPLDYTVLEVTAEARGVYLTVGTFGGDFSGEYGEFGYGFQISGTDLDIGWVVSDSELALLPSGRSDATLVFGVSRTFTLR